jgi:hypothetical protein
LPTLFTSVLDIVSFFIGFFLAALFLEAWSCSTTFLVLSVGIPFFFDIPTSVDSLGFVPFFCVVGTFHCAG